MTFKEALAKLNIEDYGERIFNSSSHGELMHLWQYVALAENLSDATWFRDWFVALVKGAEAHWQRPESIFQHVLRAFNEDLKDGVPHLP